MPRPEGPYPLAGSLPVYPRVKIPPVNTDRIFAHLIFRLGVSDRQDRETIEMFVEAFGFPEYWVLRQIECRLGNLSDAVH